MQLACSVPSPTMCLLRHEGVVRQEDPRGIHCGHHLLSLGEGKPRQEAQGATLVTKSSPELCGFCWVPVVYGQSPEGEPRCESQASYWGGVAGGVLATLSVVPATLPTTVTPGPCHRETLLPSSTCRAVLRS